jgi:mannose-6-phosphate isomerase-like protein (cupin superfamily)
VDAFEIGRIESERAAAGELYREFMRVPALSVGLYVLEQGGQDTQAPHNEDEIYYVLSGRAQVHVGGEDRPVQEGSVVFVAAHVEHRFHSIEERLSLLVVFGPAETG